ncbi:MAG: MFS transporter, partial [Candidatus Marinimicrobia bacterium]|nr:MFS transporter [Candidatus Neomarinimicrobiota bacterium]
MPTKPKFFYGWIIVLSSFVILFISQAYTLGGLSVFDKEILREFGWTVGDYKLKGLITFLFAGLLAPFMGALADKHGVRPLMIVGTFLLAMGYFMYSKIATLTNVYIIHILFAGALASAGLVVNVMLVSRWFNKRRGTALGLILMGTSLGNMIVPKINVQLISIFQWRPSFIYLAIVPLILIPVILFIIKEYPSDMGVKPDGATEDEPDASSAEHIEKGGMDYSEAMKNRNF